MLASVLLHVVPAAGPVDPAFHFGSRRRQRRFQNVTDSSSSSTTSRTAIAAQRSDVERLAARGRIERSAVEIDALPVVRHGNHLRPKFAQ